MFKSFRIIMLGAATALSACTSIPLGSMYKLSRIDFMSTDLSRLRFAINLPTDLKPRQGGVHMDLAYQQGEKPEEKRVIKLAEATTPADFVGLPAGSDKTKTYVFKLPENEVVALNKIRVDAAASKAAGKKGSLTMGVAAKEFCANAEIPNAPLLITTYVLTSENADYVVLTQNIDLRSDDTINASLNSLSPCNN
jgi:hypothetical protein